MKAQENVLREIIELCETAIEQDLLSEDEMTDLETDVEPEKDEDERALEALANEDE